MTCHVCASHMCVDDCVPRLVPEPQAQVDLSGIPPAYHKHMKFLVVAQSVASLSKDPSTKVGAVALDDRFNILAVGFNGFPRGVDDNPVRYADRDLKLTLTSHAEQNLVAQAAYSGHALAGSTVILTALHPCTSCAKSLIQAGVKVVLSPPPDAREHWVAESKWAALLFEEAGVDVYHYRLEASS